MEKILFMEELYSNRRGEFISRCAELQNQGKNFLYILPSREAIKDVRYSLLDKMGGLINSKVIMFDELELAIFSDILDKETIIYEDMERQIISDICKNLGIKLFYFEKIKSKKGFQEEVRSFIKYIKRNCINTSKLDTIIEGIEDTIIKDKLQDLKLIYEVYCGRLLELKVYDINDVSLMALEKIISSEILSKVDYLFIDGFINIDAVNIQLIKNIVDMNKVNIYINCPYKSACITKFITVEIISDFQKIGFDIQEETNEYVKAIDFGIKETALKFYSGEKVKSSLENISIVEYPCVESEVREVARSIKQRIIKGEIAEEIALYINNREEYEKHLINIFQEFNIPITIKEEVCLFESRVVRTAVEMLKGDNEEVLTLENWLERFNTFVIEARGDIKNLLVEVFNENLSKDKMLHIKALESLRKLMSDIEASLKMCGFFNLEMCKEDFIAFLMEYIQNTKIILRKASTNGVKVLNTDLAKGVYFKHVYILGLNEGEIPKLVKNQGLFDSLETEILKDKGIAFKDSLWEFEREKIRFNLAIGSAKESLALSYRSADEDGNYAISSSFLEQIKFITGIKQFKKINMRERFETDINQVMSSSELKVLLLKDVFENKYKGFDLFKNNKDLSFIKGFENNTEELINNGLVEYHRSKETDFNRYEGILKEEFKKGIYEVVKLSPSKIDSYSRCPFKFMLANIFNLKLEEEQIEEPSNMEIGNLYHKVLKLYYDKLKNFESLEEEKFNNAFMEGLKKSSIEEVCFENKIQEYRENLINFIEMDLKRMKSYEKVTGNILRPYMTDNLIGNTESFEIPLMIKVDRVDLEYEIKKGKQVPTGKYVVYDYKKKSLPNIDSLLERENCQMVFYHYAVEELLKKELKDVDIDCMGIIFLSVEGTDKSVKKDGLYRTEYKKSLDFSRNSFDMNKEVFYTLLGYFKNIIKDASEDIKEGLFPYKINCSSFEKSYNTSECEFNGICRFNSSKKEAATYEK